MPKRGHISRTTLPKTKNEEPSTHLVGVIVTHAGLGQALLEAAAAVAGEAHGLATLSNEDLSLEALGQRLRDLVQRFGAAGCIVFVDSRGSSCAVCSVDVLRDLRDVRIISGVNLPMLVDFLLRRKDQDLDAMVERLLQRGRSSVQLLKGPGS